VGCYQKEITVETPDRTALVDISDPMGREVEQSGVGAGMCWVFVPHTTCGVTINEAADPDVARDIIAALERFVPAEPGLYRHAEGNSPAHVKASLLGSSAWAPVADGRLQLGRWQGVFLAEFDGPRRRRVRVTVMGE